MCRSPAPIAMPLLAALLGPAQHGARSTRSRVPSRRRHQSYEASSRRRRLCPQLPHWNQAAAQWPFFAYATLTLESVPTSASLRLRRQALPRPRAGGWKGGRGTALAQKRRGHAPLPCARFVLARSATRAAAAVRPAACPRMVGQIAISMSLVQTARRSSLENRL